MCHFSFRGDIFFPFGDLDFLVLAHTTTYNFTSSKTFCGSQVYKRSYDLCMQLYEKELLTDTSFLYIYGYVMASVCNVHRQYLFSFLQIFDNCC